MTFTQPFASPEVDLERMRLSAFICLLLLVPSNSCFFPPSFSHLSFFCRFSKHLFFFHPRSLFSLSLSAFLCYTAEGSKCKSSRTVFFSSALISADDVSKEVRGTTQRPPQLLSPIHHVQIYVCHSLFSLSPPLSLSFLPHFQHYQYRSGRALRTSL